MKPNIFDIATKELSQDAFITWLLAFADNENQQYDKELNLCAKEFVSMLIKKQIPNFNEPILTVEAGRQWENIDVWAEVNGKYLIIIEDKTISSEHSNQLERYKEIAEKWCSENKYETPICIYLKTGNESLSIFNAIKDKGYAIFDRTDFITLLNNHKDIKSSLIKMLFIFEKIMLLAIHNQSENKFDFEAEELSIAIRNGLFCDMEYEITNVLSDALMCSYQDRVDCLTEEETDELINSNHICLQIKKNGLVYAQELINNLSNLLKSLLSIASI